MSCAPPSREELRQDRGDRLRLDVVSLPLQDSEPRAGDRPTEGLRGLSKYGQARAAADHQSGRDHLGRGRRGERPVLATVLRPRKSERPPATTVIPPRETSAAITSTARVASVCTVAGSLVRTSCLSIGSIQRATLWEVTPPRNIDRPPTTAMAPPARRMRWLGNLRPGGGMRA
jgi:hypothetical protein